VIDQPSSKSTRREETMPSLDEAMRRHIEDALKKTAGRVEGPFGAARVLGINANTLRARMRKCCSNVNMSP
jgi:transcriptional regulator with GAF, ATPase, and Fis domain